MIKMTIFEMITFVCLLGVANLVTGLLMYYIMMNLCMNEKFVLKQYKKIFKMMERILEKEDLFNDFK